MNARDLVVRLSDAIAECGEEVDHEKEGIACPFCDAFVPFGPADLEHKPDCTWAALLRDAKAFLEQSE
jgi:hypothetical protein